MFSNLTNVKHLYVIGSETQKIKREEEGDKESESGRWERKREKEEWEGKLKRKVLENLKRKQGYFCQFGL